jgi:hypothetical protein
MIRLSQLLAMSALAVGIAATSTNAAASATSRALDYQFGTWRVHVASLTNPAAAHAHWTHYDGTHSVMPLLEGRANLGVLEVAGPAGSVEGMQLRLYDPQTQRWNLSFANGSDGELGTASVGRFAGERGTFFSSERIGGRNALIRTQTIVQNPSAYRDVTSYSTDGGVSWQAIWIASYVKISSAPSLRSDETPASRHAFDFQVGSWHVRLARLAERLRGSTAWRNYVGTLVVRRLWNGRANVGVLEVRSGKDCLESILLRTFDPQTGQWRDYGANPATGTLGIPPTIGRFSNGRGEFYDRETLDGRPIVVHGVFDEITARSNRFVQSFSADGGKSWEPNLIVHFTRDGSR